MIRRSIRAFVILTLAVPFLLVSLLSDMLVRNRRKKLVYFLKTTSFFSNVVLKVLGIKVKVRNYERLSKTDESCLIVSNHLSYIDVLIISSVIPPVFIASIDEVRDRFLVGTVAKFGGSVFVERRNRAYLSQEIKVISDLLNEGFNVVLFPEGSTSNGERVLSFKSSFIAPAIKSNVDILPICLKYLRINGESINPENRDLVFY
ncbi:MAG TPA: lysophospholipid acyltransferase family protein [Thermodesulfobacteriota bacterium]|nr:lysophospholipid acyltransferase family protein [Thermodesulfobacteriota bacterium]